MKKKDLLARIEQLEARLNQLEINNIPVIPKIAANTCKTCGVIFGSLTNYWCGRSDCPSFVNPTFTISYNV
jgi:ABC-type xylose transport system permease subunit